MDDASKYFAKALEKLFGVRSSGGRPVHGTGTGYGSPPRHTGDPRLAEYEPGIPGTRRKTCKCYGKTGK